MTQTRELFTEDDLAILFVAYQSALNANATTEANAINSLRERIGSWIAEYRWPSESPTHPDAPRAGGETPAIDVPATLDALLWAAIQARINAGDKKPLDGPGLKTQPQIFARHAEALANLRYALPSLLERHRDGERETVCGMRFVVDRTIPPGEIHMRQDGRVVARLINVTDGEVAVGSAPPSPERASK